MEEIRVILYIGTIFAMISVIACAVIHIIIELIYWLLEKLSYIFKKH